MKKCFSSMSLLPLPASQPTPNSEQEEHSMLLYGLPAHIQVGRAEEPTPQQISSKKITIFPHKGEEAKSQCKLFKLVSTHSLQHHHYNSHLKCLNGYPGRIPPPTLFHQGANSANAIWFTSLKGYTPEIQRLLRMLPTTN